MFMPHGGNGLKPVHQIKEVSSDKRKEIRGLKNAIKKRGNFAPRQDAWFAADSYTEPHGAMFGIGDGDPQGFLALTKSDEKGTAAIRQLRLESRDPQVAHALLLKAITYLKDRGIHDVTIKVSEAYRDIEHVLEEFNFHAETEEDGMRLFRAHL